MLVGDWMAENVTTVTEDVSLTRAARLMREKNVRRLPVLDAQGLLAGIVTDWDVRTASPSKATSLDIYEINYLLSEITVGSIMTRNPYTVRATDTVVRAAATMRDRKIGGLPVLDEDGKVVGIITDTDIFRAFTSISGADVSAVQVGLRVSQERGSLKAVIDILHDAGARMLSVLTAHQRASTDTREVYLRFSGLDEAETKALLDALAKSCSVLYCVRD